MKLAAAESCTGGLVASKITALSGASNIFERGFVTYSNEAKIDLLGVNPKTLIDYGAVSAETAHEMAIGAIANSRADIAVSITGIAGPGGESKDKPVGLVHFGYALKNGAAGSMEQLFTGNRTEIQERAANAIANGYFESQITPVAVKVRRDMVDFKVDEHPKATSTEALAGLRTVFQKDGTVTAGNASGINDGAAAIVLATASAAEKAGLKPRARILGYAHAGVRPEVMGIGPVPAVENLLVRTGLSIADFDVVESNEAFAAQALAVNKGLGLDPAKVNPNGGAIALGHPVGATGAIITIKALHELERIGGKRALITMCIGGGQGIALAIERL